LSDTVDLVETLATAAAEAVRARRGAIEAGGATVLRSIVIALEPANNGAVMHVETRVNWHHVVRAAQLNESAS